MCEVIYGSNLAIDRSADHEAKKLGGTETKKDA